MVAETPNVNLVPGQNVADSIYFVPVPEKRKKRARKASVGICAITASLVIAYSIVFRNVVVYYPGPTQKNTTNVCYKKEEKLTLPGFLATALSLFGVVLGTLVDRLSLIAEERHHLYQRYDGSREKMIKACFSGISWGPVIVLLALAALIVVGSILLKDKAGKPWFDLSYLVYIFGGIGVGPLVMHLLNLNTESEVYISTIREEKEMFVANGLAWSYYFNYLTQALPKFKVITSRPFPAPHENIELSLNKLLLLIPHDCHMTDDLQNFDHKIDKLFETGNDQEPFSFSVYCLTVSENEQKYFAIQYVKEPLKTLREMSLLEDIKGVKRQTCLEEVKLLYRTLSRILKDPPDQDFKGTCLLLPIIAEYQESLQNGGLVKCIMDIVRPSRSTHIFRTSETYPSRIDDAPGFMKPRSEKLCVNDGNSFKLNSRSAQTGGQSGLIHNDKQQDKRKWIDSETGNKQDDESNDKKGKQRLKREYKNKKSDHTELQVMIPTENHDTPCTDQGKPSNVSRQEVGDGNDSGASTSGNNPEMADIANQQSEQQDDHQSSNTTPHETEL